MGMGEEGLGRQWRKTDVEGGGCDSAKQRYQHKNPSVSYPNPPTSQGGYPRRKSVKKIPRARSAGICIGLRRRLSVR
jgi:hypothetical protein